MTVCFYCILYVSWCYSVSVATLGVVQRMLLPTWGLVLPLMLLHVPCLQVRSNATMFDLRTKAVCCNACWFGSTLYICTHTHMYKHTYVYPYIRTHILEKVDDEALCINVYIYLYVYIYTHTHTHTQSRMYVYSHLYTHTQTHTHIARYQRGLALRCMPK